MAPLTLLKYVSNVNLPLNRRRQHGQTSRFSLQRDFQPNIKNKCEHADVTQKKFQF